MLMPSEACDITYIRTYIHTYRQTDRQTETGRQTDGQTDRQTNMYIYNMTRTHAYTTLCLAACTYLHTFKLSNSPDSTCGEAESAFGLTGLVIPIDALSDHPCCTDLCTRV